MSNSEGYVYFITTSAHKAIKIGFSKNVERRMKQLQTSSSEELEILYVVEGNMDLEHNYHYYFKDYNIKNEWFQYSFVMSFIKHDKLEKHIQREMGYIK